MSMSRVALREGGVQVSQLVYGVWRFFNEPLNGQVKNVSRLIDLCLDLGITSFDHADIYGGYRCEELFGQCMDPKRRQKIELISKCSIRLPSPLRPENRLKSYDSSAAHIRASVELSLKNLRTDYLDLLLLHRPDPLMDADEVADTAMALKKEGKIRGFGVSNFLPAQMDLLQSRYPDALETNQIEVHPLRASVFFDGSLDHAQLHRYRPMAWSPLAGGRLVTTQPLAARMEELALAKGCSLEALALAWLLRHPAGIVPVLGSISESRLQAMALAPEIALDRETWFEILQLGLGGEIP